RRDIIGCFEYAERTRALRMGLPLWNLLPVEMRHLLQEMYVMQENGTLGADRQGIAIARRRCAGAHGRTVCHGVGHCVVPPFTRSASVNPRVSRKSSCVVSKPANIALPPCTSPSKSLVHERHMRKLGCRCNAQRSHRWRGDFLAGA